MDREWELKALCRSGHDPDIWFSRRTWTVAKRLCEVCPVRDECLEAILAREAQTPDSLRAGIAAGLTGAQRASLARARRREEPVKPRPKPPGAGRAKAPCGTKSAYERHRRLGEPIDQACREANARANREYRRTGSTRVPAGR
ncbi:WhiB family transcriptional regulator [Streptomyces antibioticus]|uniref:WhiB family transcriptional regulator n=1 Tax=Streptomyces antibioticus TaxID=1890 RepID=UPI00371A21F1